MLKEVKRVLKPGGKMFYMEHIIAEEGSYLRILQRILLKQMVLMKEIKKCKRMLKNFIMK